MTGPKRKVKVQTAVKTEVPAAVQAILDQLTTVEPVVEPVVDPFSRPVTKDPFASTAFASTAYVSDAFAATAAAAANVFGPADSTAFAPRASSAFGAVPSNAFGPKSPKLLYQGKHRLIRRTYILPPPGPQPAEGEIRYWMPLCRFLEMFSDSNFYRQKLFQPGQGFDFSRGEDADRLRCMEDQYEGDEWGNLQTDHVVAPWDENMCGSPDHKLWASQANSLEDMLTWCGCDFDVQSEWDQLVPLLRALKKMAFEEVEDLVWRVDGVRYIHMVAGIFRRLQPGHTWEQDIIDAVQDGPRESGLAAAWADFMVRDYTRAFCSHLDCERCDFRCSDPCGVHGCPPADECDCLACEIRHALLEMEREGCMPPHPQGIIVFDDLREPVEFEERPYAGVVPRITGTYVIRSMEYHSALVDREVDTLTGEVGWNVFHMVPFDPEIMKEAGEVNDDEDMLDAA